MGFLYILLLIAAILSACEETRFAVAFTTPSNSRIRAVRPLERTRQSQIQLHWRLEKATAGSNNPVHFNWQSSVAAVSLLLAILFHGSPPALAMDDSVPSTTTDSMDVSKLIQSLQPATESRPQIPFPTAEALQRAAAATPNKPQTQQSLSRENSYALQALVNVESTSRSAPRLYNGADVLVLKVWTDQPNKNNNDNDNNDNDNNKNTNLGGAKIPIGAIVGGFPVRVSLGPQNALSSHDHTANEPAVQQWKDRLSSQNVWVQATVCRHDSSQTAHSGQCPKEYPTPVLEGVGFSKFLNLPNADSGGIRTPVSLVLGNPR